MFRVLRWLLSVSSGAPSWGFLCISSQFFFFLPQPQHCPINHIPLSPDFLGTPPRLFPAEKNSRISAHFFFSLGDCPHCVWCRENLCALIFTGIREGPQTAHGTAVAPSHPSVTLSPRGWKERPQNGLQNAECGLCAGRRLPALYGQESGAGAHSAELLPTEGLMHLPWRSARCGSREGQLPRTPARLR